MMLFIFRKIVQIHSPIVIVEHYKSRRLGLCGIVLAVVIFISVIVAVTIQQFDNDPHQLPDLSKVSVTHGTNPLYNTITLTLTPCTTP
jgi:predicted PurR-regulated permease PerM